MQQYLPFTVLKRYGNCHGLHCLYQVATVLTVYGIETYDEVTSEFKTELTLQQYLPFTVLKHVGIHCYLLNANNTLQQYLPFTVLKQPLCVVHVIEIYAVATVLTVYGIETCLNRSNTAITIDEVATVLTVYGIETTFSQSSNPTNNVSCNSTYRLRY